MASNRGVWTVVAVATLATVGMCGSLFAADKTLKVYIMAGQSNMQGMATVGTLQGIALDPKTKPLYDKLVDKDGKPRVFDTVYIASFSNQEKHGLLTAGYGWDNRGGRIGPELAFGATLAGSIKEPILIIKTSWGGQSLNVNFRPPSAGRTKEIEGYVYDEMMKRINSVLEDPGKFCKAYDPRQGYELAGFVWFQAWNDMTGGTGAAYTELQAHFIRDIRKDLNAPQMPFVIGVSGHGGEKAPAAYLSFRKHQAATADMPEFRGNVVAVETAPFWDDRLQELQKQKEGAEYGGRYDREKKYTEIRQKIMPLLEERSKLTTIRRKSAEQRARVNELNKEILKGIFSPADLEYYQKNQSHAFFHYNGSAKTYCLMGEAFAKAMIGLGQTK